jgi:hypothetical protein
MVESQNLSIPAALWRRHSGLWRKHLQYRPIFTTAVSPKTATDIRHGPAIADI